MVNLKRCLSKDRLQADPFILASQANQVFYVQDLVENDRYVVLACPPKGLRNSNTYDLDYAYLSTVVDFQGTKCKDDEAIGVLPHICASSFQRSSKSLRWQASSMAMATPGVQ